MSELDPRRLVPRTDQILGDPAVRAIIEKLGPTRVKAAVKIAQDAVRNQHLAPTEVIHSVLSMLAAEQRSLRPVLNATGVVLHTNLGRAPLSADALDALVAAAGYVDVEYDVKSGQRARRGRGALHALRTAVPLAEDVLVVNNGAAALVLAVTALARGGQTDEVLMSRGEMVEIGDGFRLPELIESAGAKIVEVGTTNRTTVTDYERAISSRTACMVKVHPSNFRIEGFTASPSIAELAALTPPLVVDTGSGLLSADSALPDEPDVTSALAGGANLVLCSGDKLLGGPQSGLLFGQATLIELLRRDPLARALRVDKLTLAALEATVEQASAHPGLRTPTWQYLHADSAQLRARTLALAASLPNEIDARVVQAVGAVGGGGAPGLELPGWALSLPDHYAEQLRQSPTPVVGRTTAGRCLLDLRCVPPAQDASVRAAICAVAAIPAPASQAENVL